MIQRRYGARFALKALAELLATGLDRDGAAEPRIGSTENLAHERFDPIRTQPGAESELSGCGTRVQ
jgi:hypothetical protein